MEEVVLVLVANDGEVALVAVEAAALGVLVGLHPGQGSIAGAHKLVVRAALVPLHHLLPKRVVAVRALQCPWVQVDGVNCGRIVSRHVGGDAAQHEADQGHDPNEAERNPPPVLATDGFKNQIG